MTEQTQQNSKKRFYKRWWFWLIVVIVVGFIWMGSGDSGDSGSASSNATETTTAKSDNQPTPAMKTRTTEVGFSNTYGKQTTTVDKATIEQVPDKLRSQLVDDIHYVLLVHMSIKNEATESASAFPGQDHVVLSDGTQIDGDEMDDQISTAFEDGDIASGATISGDVWFPLTEKQAKTIKKAQFKFTVTPGDENADMKNYVVNLQFK